ncbi:hypothetical protein [Acinetobacter venetianus]|uniref:hypothetical protein n=1 Tax=Acinetobacter venetianus TaxID=52133 RepID=UPI002AC141DA|nr:hypothetical protein [Acinetobacter venetianus]
MANLKKGDRVKVDFTNNPETIHAGIRFTGYGVVDRVEDGRVFGRLDDGQTFMCLEGDVEVRQHKYDWSVIPDHVAYMATDADGVACGWLVDFIEADLYDKGLRRNIESTIDELTEILRSK